MGLRLQRWVVAWVLLGALLPACRSEAPVTAIATGRLEVRPASLDAGQLWLGVAHEATFTVTWLGQTTVDAQLDSVDEVMAPETLTLPPGTPVALQLTLQPSAVGPFRTHLHLTAENDSADLEVFGTVNTPPTCAAPSACERAWFDVTLGACRTEPQPDDSPCDGAAACLQNARCHAGQCVGTSNLCDDGNPCTADLCVAGRCDHRDATDRCPASSDPCQVPVCTNASGCGFAPALDGASCGVADCVTAHVCIQGRCETRPVPEGARCGEATLCRAAGVCHDQRCEQPELTALTPTWTLSAPALSEFPSVVDERGSTYWFENSGHTYVAADAQGHVTARVPLPLPHDRDQSNDSHFTIIDDTAVLTLGELHALTGLDAATGTRLWLKTSADLNGWLNQSPSTVVWVKSLAEQVSPRALVVLVVSNAGGADWRSAIVSVEPRTGAVRWVQRSTYLTSLVVDASDQVWSHESLFTSQRLAFSASGAPLVVQPGPGQPMAAAGSEVVVAGWPATTVTTAGTDGGSLAPLSASPYDDELLLNGSLVARLMPANSCSRSAEWLKRTHAPTHGIVTPDPELCLSELTLAQNDTLFMRSTARSPWLFDGLHLLRLDGTAVLECDIGVTGTQGVLGHERYLTWDSANHQVLSYDLPGVAPAADGWVSQRGNSRHSRRPR